MPSHPCTFAPAGPPARHVLPFPFPPIRTTPSLPAPAPALLPAKPSQPRCPLCSLPPRISENTYCWHHCSGLSHVLLGNLAGIVGLLEPERLFCDSHIHVQGAASLGGALGREVTAPLWCTSRAREVGPTVSPVLQLTLGKSLTSLSLGFPIRDTGRFNFEVASCSRTLAILPLITVSANVVGACPGLSKSHLHDNLVRQV